MYGSIAMLDRALPLLSASGYDTDALLRQVGIDPVNIQDRSALVRFDDAVALYQLAAELLQDEHVGLRIAENASWRAYGILGFFIAYQDTLRHALQDIDAQSRVLLSGVTLRYTKTEAGASFACEHPRNTVGDQQMVEDGLRGVLGVAQCHLIRPMRLLEVHLKRRTGNLERLTRSFGAPVHLGATTNAIHIPDDVLDTPIRGADPVMIAHLRDAAATSAIRRRARAGSTKHQLVRLQSCVVDLERQELRNNQGNVVLTDREHQLLSYLIEHANRTVSHTELERDVWGVANTVLTHAPAVAIRRLRRKIESDPATPTTLLTVHGEGWRLVVPSGG